MTYVFFLTCFSRWWWVSWVPSFVCWLLLWGNTEHMWAAVAARKEPQGPVAGRLCLSWGFERSGCLPRMCRHLCFGDSGVPGAWERAKCEWLACMLSWASGEQGSGASAGEGSYSKSLLSLASTGHGSLSQPQLLCCLQKHGGESVPSIPLHEHFFWRLYFKWPTLRKSQMGNQFLKVMLGRKGKEMVNIHDTTAVSLYNNI